MMTLQQLIDDYESPNTKTRKERRKKTQEIFTPYCIVKKLMDKIPEKDWQDLTKTFLDPAMGNGNIILGILYRRIVEHGIDWETALRTCYGVELMQDNVRETMDRVHEMLGTICDDYNKEVAENIMKTNLVCSNFFEWDFEEWRPK